MTKLPRISGAECVKALQQAGFVIRRQKGSHIILRRDEPYAQIVVPNHRELHIGTLGDIIKDAGLSVEEFIELL